VYVFCISATYKLVRIKPTSDDR